MASARSAAVPPPTLDWRFVDDEATAVGEVAAKTSPAGPPQRQRRAALWTIFTDPEHIVRWAWSTHPKTAQRISALRAERPDLVIVRLTFGQRLELGQHPAGVGQ